MLQVVIALLTALTVYYLLLAVKFLVNYKIKWDKVKDFPGPPAKFLIGNLLQIPVSNHGK